MIVFSFSKVLNSRNSPSLLPPSLFFFCPAFLSMEFEVLFRYTDFSIQAIENNPGFEVCVEVISGVVAQRSNIVLGPGFSGGKCGAIGYYSL